MFDKHHTLIGKNFERKADPILSEPVPEMPWTVALRPDASISLSSPTAKPNAALQNSALPAIGAYSLSKALETMMLSACNIGLVKDYIFMGSDSDGIHNYQVEVKNTM